MDRRAFLGRSSATVAGLAALAGCTNDDSGSGRDGDDQYTDPNDGEEDTETDRPELPEGFDHVVDVTDQGGDPTGDDSLVPVLDSIDPDGTLVYLPEGRYRMDGSWSVDGFERVAVIGDDATIVPDPGLDTSMFNLDGRERSVDLRVEGLTFDYRHSEASGRMLHLKSRDGLLVRDVGAAGVVGSRPSLVRLDVTESDGAGLVERLELPDGGLPGTRLTGCYVGNDSRGDITFRDCYIEGFPDNGLYADPPEGSITVEGGEFANCGIASVRIRGDSTVRDATVRCDDTHREFDNMRGIRLTDYEPQHTPEPAVVENCHVEMFDLTHSDGAIELSGQLARAIVRDTHIHVDANDVPAFRAKHPEPVFEELGIEPSVRLENVTIEGAAAEGEAVRIVGRNECVFTDIDVRQTGRNRKGLRFSNSRRNVIQRARIDVTGEAIRLEDSEVDETDVDIVEQHDGELRE